MSCPLLFQAFRKGINIVDLVNRYALVGVIKHVVVEMGESIPLGPHHFLNSCIAPTWPAMGGKHHIGLTAVTKESLINLLAALQWVADQGSSRGMYVKGGAGDVLCGAEGFELWEPGVYLRWDFGARSVLELHLNPVGDLFDRFADDAGRCNEAGGSSSGVLAKGSINMSEGAARQRNSLLIKKTAVHRIAGVDVFADSVIYESHRSNPWRVITGTLLLRSFASSTTPQMPPK